MRFELDRRTIAIAFMVFGFATCRDLASALLVVPIACLCVFQLSRINSEEFTADDMLWFCFLLYFGVVPAQAITNGFFPLFGPTAGIQYSLGELVQAMLIVLAFALPFALTGLPGLVSINYRRGSLEASDSISPLALLFISAAIPIAFLAFVSFSGGLANVLQPRVERDTESVQFVAYIFLALGCVCTLNLVAQWRSGRWPALVIAPICIAALLMQAVLVNIFNSSRFFLIGSWLPILLIALKGRLRFTHVYILLMAGIFFVMPFLSISTRYGSGGADGSVSINAVEESVFLIRDVDIFETLTHTVGYVSHWGYWWGENLLAILLFFVPRSIWPDKPIVGGLLVGDELYQLQTATTPNLSFFIAGDAYLDFGFIGVVLVGLISGAVFHRMIRGKREEMGDYQSLILIGVIPILMRGPVGAVIGYPLCLIICNRLVFRALRLI